MTTINAEDFPAQDGFITSSKSSVKIKLTSKGHPTVEVKIYQGTTAEERETIYNQAVEIIDRLKMRYFKHVG